MSTAEGTSFTGMVKWDFVLSGGLYGESAMTDRMWAYTLPWRRDPRPPSHSPECPPQSHQAQHRPTQRHKTPLALQYSAVYFLHCCARLAANTVTCLCCAPSHGAAT